MKRQTAPATAGDDGASVRKRFRERVNEVSRRGPGATAAADEVRAMLREHPGLELWRDVHDLGAAALNYLLQKETAGAALSLCWARQLEAMQAEMRLSDAAPAERLLIRHVALCWLQLNLLEFQYAEVIAGDVPNMTIRRAAFWDRRLTLAQRRLTRATEALARLRLLTKAARLADERRGAPAAPRPLRVVPGARAS